MREIKYMTASEYFRNEIPLRVKIYMDEFNKSKLVLEKLDTHFINKDLLKDKINNQINFVEKYNKQTMFGATLMDKEGYVCPSLNKYALNKDKQKGYIKAMKEILELLK